MMCYDGALLYHCVYSAWQVGPLLCVPKACNRRADLSIYICEPTYTTLHSTNYVEYAHFNEHFRHGMLQVVQLCWLLVGRLFLQLTVVKLVVLVVPLWVVLLNVAVLLVVLLVAMPMTAKGLVELHVELAGLLVHRAAGAWQGGRTWRRRRQPRWRTPTAVRRATGARLR